jgi:ankyrin repeat protein
MASNILLNALDGCNTPEELMDIIDNDVFCDRKLAQETDANGNYPLFIACQQICYESIAMKLYEEYPESLQRHGWDNKRNPLHIACKLGDIETVKSIISRYSYLTMASDAYGRTPIFYACQYDRAKVLDLLLGKLNINIDINQQDKYGQSVLHKSCMHGSLRAINKLLMHPNINVYGNDNDGNAAFYYLVKYFFSITQKSRYKKVLATLQRFLELHPNCNHYRHPNDGRTLFHDIIIHHWHSDKEYTYQAERMESFLLLPKISNGINEVDNMGLAPLHLICRYNEEAVVPMAALVFVTDMLQGIVLINKTDNEGKNVLHHACLNGHGHAFEYLIYYYPYIQLDIQDNFGNTPLHYAVIVRKNNSGNYLRFKRSIVEAILESHPHLVMRTNNAGETPYHIALINKEKMENEYPPNQRRIIIRENIWQDNEFLTKNENLDNWIGIVRALEDATVKVRMQMFLYIKE